jgi:outer membrane protein
MMRIFSTLVSALFCTTAFTQEKWDLHKCVDYAFANNISVKQADVQARLSKLTLKQSKGSLYPTLGGGLNGSYQHGLNENPTTGTLESANFFSGSLGLQSGYTIFNWGARKNNILANELFAKADELGVDKTKNDVALFVANAFLQVMLRREQVRISEVQVNQSKEQLRITRRLVNAGSQPELNAIQIEAQLARDSSALLQAQALAEQGIINLKATLNLDMAVPFDIAAPALENIPVDNITDLQPEAVYNQALATQPLQKMFALRIEGSNYQVKAARGAMYPTLSAFGGLNTRFVSGKFPYLLTVAENVRTGAYVVNQTGDKLDVLIPRQNIFGQRSVGLFTQMKNNFGQSVGLSINFPIFNAWNTRTQWERTKIGTTQYMLQDEQERLTLKTNIYNAYQDAFSSLQKYNASSRNVLASQKALDFARKRYDIGLLGTLDYIITQNNLFRARIEEVSNRYDFVFKMKVLEFYKGEGIRL